MSHNLNSPICIDAIMSKDYVVSTSYTFLVHYALELYILIYNLCF
jgi:hypothetical protein